MDSLINDLFLNQWFLIFVLGIIFATFSNWAMSESRLGYALGWLLGIFFILVYTALGGGATAPEGTDDTLNLLQVIIPTLCGLTMGGGVILTIALVRGSRERERSLLIAFLTALNISLLFLVLVEGRITQVMIGIYALAFCIAALFIAILSMDRFSEDDSAEGVDESGRSAQDIRNNRRSGGRSRVDRIRDDMDGNR